VITSRDQSCDCSLTRIDPYKDPEIISAWLKLVEETKAKYGVHDDDVHNFDESGFQMGVIGIMKVVTGSERRARPDIIQPGDRE
jgi:hypothetical protein